MDEILLRKIEELTLYMIEQEKKIENLKAANTDFEDFDGLAFPARHYNYGVSIGLGYNL